MKFDDNFERHMLSMYRPGSMNLKTTTEARTDAGGNLDWQRLLALEDRRSFAREYVRDHPVIGLPAMFAAPVIEMGAKGGGKAIEALTGRNPYPYPGRSGFFDPLANIGAGWKGAAQGIGDLFRDWFSSGNGSQKDPLNDLYL